MSGGHTPGPWEIAPETYRHDRGEVEWRWIGPVNWRTRVARVVIHAGEETEQEANARLIAAAPEMFDYIAVKAEEGDAEALQIMEALNANS